MQLRDYQRDFHGAAMAALSNGKRSTLAVMPTGTGKTVCFATLADDWTRTHQKRALILAHREELIFQAAEKVKQISGYHPDIEMGEMTGNDSLFRGSRIIVSSVQTMCRPNRHARYNPEDFSLVIVDEAHHCCPKNKSYNSVINHFTQNPDCRLLGVTATPDRADEEALGQMFDSVCFELGILDAINAGWLVPIHQQFIHVEKLDLSEVKTSDGDFTDSDLSRVVGGVIHEIAAATTEAACGRPTLVFVPGRKRGEAGSDSPMLLMARALNELHPGTAAYISGDPNETPKEERRSLIDQFKRGEKQFLVSCGVFLEGFDAPNTAVIAMARPTKSRALYAQAVGRGTRPLSGLVDGLPDAAARTAAIESSAKPYMTVLDFVGNSGKHKLISVADILGGKWSEAAVEKVINDAKKSGVSVNIRSAVEIAEAQIREQIRIKKEAEAKRRLVAKVKFSARNVDPFDILDLSPSREPGWHKGRKPTTKQAEILTKNGVPVGDDLTFCQASQLIGEIFRRRDDGLCTFKQAKLLTSMGDPHAEKRGFTEASQLIDAAAKNKWTLPVEMLATVPMDRI